MHRAVPPPPPWPESREEGEWPEDRTFKVVFDTNLEREVLGPNGSANTPALHAFYTLLGVTNPQFREMVQKIQEHGDHETVNQRVKKGKGKDMRLLRFEGEVLDSEGWKEPVPDPKDPRPKKLPSFRPLRNEFLELKYEVRRGHHFILAFY